MRHGKKKGRGDEEKEIRGETDMGDEKKKKRKEKGRGRK